MPRLALLLALCLVSAAPAAERDPPVIVFAAASLTDVLGELAGAWERRSGLSVKTSFAASSLLARQIEAGGRVDIFVSADRQWMDYLETRALVTRASRRDLARNRLVLVAPSDSTIELRIAGNFRLADALGSGRLSVADPDAVPAGRYAREALTGLGVWSAVERRLARADNVRAALLFVARGETPLGIVYATDAQREPEVRVVDVFPEEVHSPITHPAALVRGATPRAAEFLAFAAGPEAAPVWKKYGFLTPAR